MQNRIFMHAAAASLAVTAALSVCSVSAWAEGACTPGKTKKIAFMLKQQTAFRYLHADVPFFKKTAEAAGYEVLVQSADIITNKRSLESTVLVDNGNIVVLGGLIQDDQQSSVDKVPLLGDIPWIGSLFKYESRSRKRTNLMIFLRPVVIKDDRGAAAITADRYEYIRNLQGDIRLPWNGLLPPAAATPMPPLEEQNRQPLGTPPGTPSTPK